MVSRPAADRQFLDLQNAVSAAAWIISFVHQYRAEKKENNISTDGPIQDSQLTISFFVWAGKVKSLNLGAYWVLGI